MIINTCCIYTSELCISAAATQKIYGSYNNFSPLACVKRKINLWKYQDKNAIFSFYDNFYGKTYANVSTYYAQVLRYLYSMRPFIFRQLFYGEQYLPQTTLNCLCRSSFLVQLHEYIFYLSRFCLSVFCFLMQ